MRQKFIAAVLVFMTINVMASSEAATPDIFWVPNSLDEVVEIGGGKTVPISFTATDDFAVIDVFITPELQSYVRTVPSTLSDITKGETRNISIILSAPSDSPSAILDSVILLRSAVKTLAKPLPVILDVREDTGPPLLEITEPPNFSLFGESPITVTGTVSKDAVTVEVNGLSAPLSSTTWTATVPIAEGNNVISAVATDQVGNVATASIQVTLDTQPPMVTIESASVIFGHLGRGRSDALSIR